jgi:SHOCT-like domain
MTTQTLSLGSNPVLEIEHVGGDAAIEGWEKPELQAQGDEIQIDQSDGPLKISCDGDLKLSLPRATKLTISFVGGELKAQNLDGPMEVSFVGGDAVLRNLKGQVSLTGLVGGETKLENVSRVSMEANRRGGGPDISDQVKRKVEKATRRAEQKMRRVESKVKIAEQKLNRHAHMRANIDVGRWKWNVTPGSVPPSPINEPVSDEERMTILKMLQEKKITSEQADKLLAALEGGQ